MGELCWQAVLAARCQQAIMLVFPDDPGFLDVLVLRLQFTRDIAERLLRGLREIRSRSIPLGGWITCVPDQTLFLRNRCIGCVCRMRWWRVRMQLTADVAARVLAEGGRGREQGREQGEGEKDLFHHEISQVRRKRGNIDG